MTQYLGIEISDEALGIAIQGRKIEAIRLVRGGHAPGECGYVGLKDAKDAVEAAMAHYDVTTLRRERDEAQSLARSYQQAHSRLSAALSEVQRDLADAQSDLRRLREVVSDHVLGIRLIVPLVERYDDSDDSPF